MNNIFRKFVFTVFILVVIMLIIVRWPKDSSLTNLQKAGAIRIGYAIEAPYVILKAGGEVTGSEIEMAKAVVSDLRIPHIDWRVYEFNSLIPALEDGQIDAIVAGMFITPERATLVSFSNPTFHVREGMLVAAGNPKQLHSYKQVATLPEVKIAVISGAVEGLILKQLGVKDTQIVEVPDALTGQIAVESGIVDGMALSSLSIRWMALQDQLGYTEIAEPFESANLPDYQNYGYGAVVFRKGSEQLRIAWNNALATFLASPAHLQIMEDFGFTGQELPGNVNTQEILSQP